MLALVLSSRFRTGPLLTGEGEQRPSSDSGTSSEAFDLLALGYFAQKIRSRGGFQCDAIAVSLQYLHSAARGMSGVSLIDLRSADLVVRRLTIEKMINGDGKTVGDGDYGLLVTAVTLESAVAAGEGGVRRANRR